MEGGREGGSKGGEVSEGGREQERGGERGREGEEGVEGGEGREGVEKGRKKHTDNLTSTRNTQHVPNNCYNNSHNNYRITGTLSSGCSTKIMCYSETSY